MLSLAVIALSSCANTFEPKWTKTNYEKGGGVVQQVRLHEQTHKYSQSCLNAKKHGHSAGPLARVWKCAQVWLLPSNVAWTVLKLCDIPTPMYYMCVQHVSVRDRHRTTETPWRHSWPRCMSCREDVLHKLNACNRCCMSSSLSHSSISSMKYPIKTLKMEWTP